VFRFLLAFDIDLDGVPELIAGWSNGRIEVRREGKGDLLYKDRMTSSISKLFVCDYRMNGKQELVSVAIDGEIKGYTSSEPDAIETTVDTTVQETQLQTLMDKRNELLNELKTFENNIKTTKLGKQANGVIPANTKLSLNVKADKTTKSLQCILSTNNDTVIKVKIIYLTTFTLFDDSILIYLFYNCFVVCVDRWPWYFLKCYLLMKVKLFIQVNHHQH
jgi:Bardet-Biedl syndrome 2 protein